MYADAYLKRMTKLERKLLEGLLDGQSTTNGANFIIFVSPRIAKVNNNTITHQISQKAIVLLHNLCAGVMIVAQQVTKFLGINLL